MARIEIPIKFDLPDNWAEIVAEKLKESGDYVPVVRCKDCKYYCYGRCVDFQGLYGRPKKDDFCSYGERKEKDA